MRKEHDLGIDSMKDTEIIEMYFNRDECAIAETNRLYGTYCYAVSFQILNVKEDAEECVNDTWLRAWNTIPPTRPQRLKHFLAKITRHLSLDKYRKYNADKRGNGQMCTVLDELEECLVDSGKVEQAYEAKELAESVRHFLLTLTSRERNIFLRRYFYVESVADIAKRYDMREGNVSVILSRIRGKLKEHLKKEGYVL